MHQVISDKALKLEISGMNINAKVSTTSKNCYGSLKLTSFERPFKSSSCSEFYNYIRQETIPFAAYIIIDSNFIDKPY